ncbi:MAG: hypothetical protein P8X49_07615, partial [Syntrophobacterales bacterium]
MGARGAKEKSNFDAGLKRVDIRLQKEIWVGDPGEALGLDVSSGTFSELQIALARIATQGNPPCTLHVPRGNYTLTESEVIPGNVELRFERGGVFVMGNCNLTINGGIEAGRYQIFSLTGTGTVSFAANGPVSVVYPEWWGAAANWDDSSQTGTDDVAALEKACGAHTVVDLGDRKYAVDGQMGISSDVTFISE